MDFAEDGDLSAYSAEDIADAAEWQGDAERFANALVEAGFVDRTEAGWKLHDWEDYAGKLIERRRREAERKRKERGRPEDVQRTSGGQREESAPNHNHNNNHTEKVVDSLATLENQQHASRHSGAQRPVVDEPGEKITNRDLIAELGDAYRAIPGIPHSKGDYAFIGRLYNDFGYDRVLEAINELAYRVEAGHIPTNPLVYLKGIVKRQEAEAASRPLPRASPKAPQNRAARDLSFLEQQGA